MEIIIKAHAKEIAALVMELQGRQQEKIKLELNGNAIAEELKKTLNLPDLTAP